MSTDLEMSDSEDTKADTKTEDAAVVARFVQDSTGQNPGTDEVRA